MQDNWPKHVVAAGLLVRRGEYVLLVRTPRRGWGWPGGRIELGGDALVDQTLDDLG